MSGAATGEDREDHEGGAGHGVRADPVDSVTDDHDHDEDEGEDDDGVPAPAPDDRWLRRVLIAGSLAAVVIAVVVAAVLMWPSGGTAQAAPSSNSADAGFARDMAVHHQQAVELSFIIRDRTGNDEVRTLAYDIINTQANQRGMLLGWLETWGLPKSSQDPPMSWMNHDMKGTEGMKDMPGMDRMEGMEGMDGMNYRPHDGSLMPGMATNQEMDELRKAKGKDAEILYLRLMTAHHKGGIAMADGAAEAAKTEEVRNLATGMAASQASEIRLMADMLTARGAKA